MLKIGLTGGIGCGKSTVCRMFEEWGVGVVDADLIARQLVKPGFPALTELRATFGEQILQADGSLDRVKLRALVFNNSQQKQLLDSIMHPLIYAQMALEIQQLSGVYCIVAVPLLLETRQQQFVDRVLVIDCSVETQMQRVVGRDKLDEKLVSSIISSQISREQRLTLADDVIENTGSLTQLAEQIKRLHNSYILLATVRTSPA